MDGGIYRVKHLLQAPTSDSAPRVDSGCYRWYRVQQFGWVLKATPWVLLKENYDRLWNVFESLQR